MQRTTGPLFLLLGKIAGLIVIDDGASPMNASSVALARLSNADLD